MLRRDLDAGPRPHQAVDDDVVVGRKTFGDDAQAIDHGPERNALAICTDNPNSFFAGEPAMPIPQAVERDF